MSQVKTATPSDVSRKTALPRCRHAADGTPCAAAASAARGGFSLVEVVVAMVMLAVVVSSLAYLTSVTAQRSINLTNAAGRQAFTLQEENRLAAIPVASLAAAVGCDTVANGQLRYRRCSTMVANSRYDSVMIIVTPLRSGTYADTVVVRRALAFTTNPLFTP